MSFVLWPIKLLVQYVNSLVLYFEHRESPTEELLKLKLNELIVLLLQSNNAKEILGIMNNLFEKKTFQFREIIKAHRRFGLKSMKGIAT